jgi:hypothetical protein
MNTETYKNYTDKELHDMLEGFLVETRMRTEFCLDFFGVSIGSWNRWKGEKQRIPHYAVNLIEWRKKYNKMQKELIVENNTLRNELSFLRDFKKRLSRLLRECL